MTIKCGIIGGKGAVGTELIKLLPTTPKMYVDSKEIIFSEIDLLFTSIPAEATPPIAKEAASHGVKVIDLSSAFRKDPSIPIILPTFNSHLINNSLKIVPLPNCVVSILLTALAPLIKITPLKQLILSTYQAASGAGIAGIRALNSEEQIPPFPHPLKDNIFLHESKKTTDGLCEEEENIIFEIKKILRTPQLPVSVRCIRVPVKRCHCIHAIVSFEQNIHNIKELLEASPHIQLHSSPNALETEGKHQVFVGDIRKDKNMPNTYDFWIAGDQLIRGAALNAYQAFQAIP